MSDLDRHNAGRHRRAGRTDPHRLVGWRPLLGLVWLASIAAASTAALVNRPRYADVASNSWILLVLLCVPGVLIALALIRAPAVLVLTALVAAGLCARDGWSTMRDTHSTASIGVFAVPIGGLVLVGIGWALDLAWRTVKLVRRSG